MKGKSDNCLNSEYVSGYKLQKMTLVQNGSKEAKSKKEKKELTQDKKLTAEESSETDIKKDSDVRTCNQNSRQNQEAKRQNQEFKQLSNFPLIHSIQKQDKFLVLIMYGTDVFSMLCIFLLFGIGLTIVSGRSLDIKKDSDVRTCN
jgi:thiol:disulfide interchange protein